MNSPIEPTADQRAFALMLRQFYIALLEQGFTEQQALVMLGQMMRASAAGGAE